MQSVNFALLNFYNLKKSKDFFDENMVDPLLTLFRDKFKLDAAFVNDLQVAGYHEER